jgi:putative addiction module component (TIGR02574 family)
MSRFEEMSIAERILYVQDLWDRIAEEPEGVPGTPRTARRFDAR